MTPFLMLPTLCALAVRPPYLVTHHFASSGERSWRTLHPRLVAATPSPPPQSLAKSSYMPVTQATSRAYIVLTALTLLYIHNQLARQLPSYLVSFSATGAARSARELMNVDLGFNAEQYGLLVSFGFTLLYVICSFPAGVACDIYPRKWLILASATGWSLATAGSALAQSFTHVICARVALGIAQAFAGPASHTLIASSFPPAFRATAHSIYTSGIYIGGAGASLSVLASRALGWRRAALLVGLSSLPPMILLAVSLPSRSASAAPSATTTAKGTGAVVAAASPARRSVRVAVLEVLSIRSVRWLLAGAAARLFAGFAIGAWVAPYYRAAFPTHVSTFSLLFAAIVAGGGTVAVVCGGLASDRVTNAGRRPERAAYIPAVGALLAIPFWLVGVRSDHFGLALLGLLGAYLCAETWFGATIAMLQAAVPRAISGTAQGMLNVIQIFSSLSPPLIGFLYRRGAPLRLLLSLLVPGAYVLTALCFWRAGLARAAEPKP